MQFLWQVLRMARGSMIDLRNNNEKSEESVFDIIPTIYIGADQMIINTAEQTIRGFDKERDHP
jgi:hypothetical protein